MDDISSIFTSSVLDKPLWMWITFIGIILTLLVLDLGVFNKKDHEIGIRESLFMSAFYISIGLLFGAWIWYNLGAEKASEYWTGFIVEKTLSMDNIFVIALIFTYFQIPKMYQHRVLFWGILGVIILRGLMISLGTTVIYHFEWVLYIFAAFLVFTGLKMLVPAKKKEEESSTLGGNKLITWLKQHIRVTDEIHGNRFITRKANEETGKKELYATPLLLALIVVEFADVIFAVDSIPAIFTITTDPYIIYTSNIFAIMGLRALYFALSALMGIFVYLKYALAVVLVFIGSKMFIVDILEMNKFPPTLSLVITLSILMVGVLCSVVQSRRGKKLKKS